LLVSGRAYRGHESRALNDGSDEKAKSGHDITGECLKMVSPEPSTLAFFQ
jgi:hypothetical protein